MTSSRDSIRTIHTIYERACETILKLPFVYILQAERVLFLNAEIKNISLIYVINASLNLTVYVLNRNRLYYIELVACTIQEKIYICVTI